MIRYITHAPISVSINYIRHHIPPGRHFLLTELEIRLLALSIMDSRGELNPNESRIFRTPLFGKTYVAEGGDLDATLLRIGFDFLPGVTLLRFL